MDNLVDPLRRATIGGIRPLLTEAEVAEVLRMSVYQLGEWRRAGVGLPYRRMGRSVRYVPADVEQYIDDTKDAAA